MPKNRGFKNTKGFKQSGFSGTRPSFGSSIGSGIGSGIGLGAGSEMAHQAVRGVFGSEPSNTHPDRSQTPEKTSTDLCAKIAQQCLQACLREEAGEKCRTLTETYQQICPSQSKYSDFGGDSYRSKDFVADEAFDIFKTSH